MKGLVDIVGGTQTLEGWVEDLKRESYKKPEKLILHITKNGEEYKGKIYIDTYTFRNPRIYNE